jgi:hypothetical protein
MEKEFAKWSVQRAIQEQVEREDTYRWATTKDEPPVLPAYTPEKKKLGHGFPLQVLKYMMP